MTYIERNEAAKLIRQGLEARTGRKWSVAVHGTRSTWLLITAPPSRRVCNHLAATNPPFGDCSGGFCVNGFKSEFMQNDDRSMLALALDIPSGIGSLGVVVYPMHRDEFIKRAQGRV